MHYSQIRNKNAIKTIYSSLDQFQIFTRSDAMFYPHLCHITKIWLVTTRSGSMAIVTGKFLQGSREGDDELLFSTSSSYKFFNAE